MASGHSGPVRGRLRIRHDVGRGRRRGVCDRRTTTIAPWTCNLHEQSYHWATCCTGMYVASSEDAQRDCGRYRGCLTVARWSCKTGLLCTSVPACCERGSQPARGQEYGHVDQTSGWTRFKGTLALGILRSCQTCRGRGLLSSMFFAVRNPCSLPMPTPSIGGFPAGGKRGNQFLSQRPP